MKGSRFYIIFFSVFIFGNAIFFLSKLFLPSSGGEYFTSPGESVSIAGHNFTLYRWDYCEATNTMEIELDIENTDFDGFDSYGYSAMTSNNKILEVTPIIEESDYLVLQIEGVPKESNIALQIESEPINDYVKIFGNTYDCRKVDMITIKTKNAYLIDRALEEIAGYEADIKDNNSTIKNLETKINNIDIATQKIESEKIYMTESEVADADEQILSNNSKKTQYLEEIENLKMANDELKYKIKFTEEKIEKLKKGD